MRQSERPGSWVAVVADDAAGGTSVAAALAETDLGVVEDGAAADPAGAVAAVRDGEAVCVVTEGADAYCAVRDVDADVPVVAVATSESVAERVVDDPAAAFVHAAGPIATLLPDRVAAVTDEGDDVVWDIASLTDEAVVQFDVETHEVLAANEAFADGWAVDTEGATLADLWITDITHDHRGQGRSAGDEQLEWITEGGPVETFVENARNGDFEVREWHCEAPDGTFFKSEVQLVVEPDAEVGYLVATVPDRTRDSGNGGLADEYDQASMLQSVMAHVPMSVYFEDRKGRHVLVSEDLVEPFIEGTDGKIMHTPEDVHGKTYWDLYTEDMANRATADNERIMQTGEPLRGQEKHVQPPHGRDLWFSTNKAPWYDEEGQIQGIVGITVDITEQKRREAELHRQNERLEEFASIVSHDLRNPLNVAEGRLELYRRTGDEEELDVVSEMHDRIADLIEEVLAFAREGQHIEDPDWVDGHPQAEQAWESVDTAEATLVQDWDYCIEADPRRLVRLFENLFRNAVEHGSTSPPSQAPEDAVEHGGTGVTVEVGTLDDRAGFYVADDGPGIPADVREELFDRGVSTNDEGTGYGLAIVREIADAHGWDVALADSDSGVPDERSESGARETSSPGARFEFTGVPNG